MTLNEKTSPHPREGELALLYEEFSIENHKQRAVLAAGLEYPYPYGAARHGGVNPGTVYKWLGRLNPAKYGQDETFMAAWECVRQLAIASLEAEAIDRARAGVGDRHSADLLKFLLQAEREKYNPKHRHQVGGDGTVVETKVTLNRGTTEQ